MEIHLFFMVLLLVVQTNGTSMLVIETIMLQMKLLAIAMLVFNLLVSMTQDNFIYGNHFLYKNGYTEFLGTTRNLHRF